MKLQYNFTGVRGTPHSASNIVLIKNPSVLLHEQANSRAPLLGLIKMAAAGMYQQLGINKRLQPTFTPKKKCKYKSLYSCEYV
jgi:hypothetical protein